MTFADKKIQEFRDKFYKANPNEVDNYHTLDQETAIDFENWIREALNEAEKNGERMAYYDCRQILNNNDEPVALDKIIKKIIFGG
jgi:hypothetical protein